MQATALLKPSPGNQRRTRSEAVELAHPYLYITHFNGSFFTSMTLTPSSFHHQSNVRCSFFSILTLMTLFMSMATTLSSRDRLGIKCKDNGGFHCYEGDPGSFTRCIGNQLHLFQCPDGLHFNTLTQTCGWPNNANCGGHGATEGSNGKGRQHVQQNKVMADAGKESGGSSWERKHSE